MKKPLVILLLVLGVMAVYAGIALMLTFLIVSVAWYAVVLFIAVGIALAVMINKLRKVLRDVHGVSTPLFMCSAFLPSAVCSAVMLGVLLHLDSIGYFGGFDGLGEMIFAFLWLAISIVMLLLVALGILIEYCKKRLS